jgi:hypothetical protein
MKLIEMCIKLIETRTKFKEIGTFWREMNFILKWSVSNAKTCWNSTDYFQKSPNVLLTFILMIFF